MRTLIVANWKMNKNLAEASQFIQDLLAIWKAGGPGAHSTEVVIAPPYTALSPTGEALTGSPLRLAAQDVSAHKEGAFTGEVSAGMLADIGCEYGLVGHSERRSGAFESNAIVAQKAEQLCLNGLKPIVCVGETLGDRESGDTAEVVLEMLRSSLPPPGTPGRDKLVVAYEPVWAIGTGLTASPEQAQAVHAIIRDCLEEEMGEAGKRTRILYGGSVNPQNVKSILSQNDIHGVLVGGASLDAIEFGRIFGYLDSEDLPS